MKKTFISISVPCYNVAPFLPRCLDSIIAQSFRDWECVCVDDGSTDETGNILDEYAEKDSRFRVIHQKNGGGNCARQVALDASVGDWIASVDADDWIDADFLQKFVEAVSGDDCEMVWCDYVTDSSDGASSVRSYQGGVESLLDYRVGLIDGRYWGALWNKCFSRTFIEKNNVRHPDGRVPVREDLWFVSDFLAATPRIKHIDACGYHYIIRPGSALQSKYDLSKFHADVRVEKFLEALDLPEKIASVFDRRRKTIKFDGYACAEISDKEFNAAFPNVRDLSGLNVPIWHKIMYWFAVRGWRSGILAFVKTVRFIKGHLER